MPLMIIFSFSHIDATACAGSKRRRGAGRAVVPRRRTTRTKPSGRFAGEIYHRGRCARTLGCDFSSQTAVGHARSAAEWPQSSSVSLTRFHLWLSPIVPNMGGATRRGDSRGGRTVQVEEANGFGAGDFYHKGATSFCCPDAVTVRCDVRPGLEEVASVKVKANRTPAFWAMARVQRFSAPKLGQCRIGHTVQHYAQADGMPPHACAARKTACVLDGL